MKTKPLFINRNIVKIQTGSTVNADALIKYFLSLHPNNKLIIGSPLYNLAVKQYNKKIKNTLVRPPVPSWFCGKVNSDTNELLLNNDDATLRANAGYSDTNVNNISNIQINSRTGYPIDKCLEQGTPGSIEYTKCSLTSGNMDEDFDDLSGINWAASFAALEMMIQSKTVDGSGGGGFESNNGELVVKNGDSSLVTYIDGILTATSGNGKKPKAIQYNDISIGEVTVWKDLSNTDDKSVSIPVDRSDKIVVWYE